MIKALEIVSAFENRTLPKSEWTHRAHLIVALWHCINFDSQTALKLLREKIKRYNESVGTANTEDEGYHETLTRFWIYQTTQFLQTTELHDFVELSNSFTLSEESAKEVPLQHYSKELLFSKRARREWVKPDVTELLDRNKRYLIIERFYPEKGKELYARFDKKGRMLPKGVKYIDSWIDGNVETCYQLMESKSIEKLEEWIEHWKDLADFEIIPVINSKAAKRKVMLRS